jgi:thioredoxin
LSILANTKIHNLLNMKLHLFFFLMLPFTILSCKEASNTIRETITPKTFSEKIKVTPNAQILDVRTPEEFESQHIENAINVDWNGDNFEANANSFNKSQPVFVYCLSGGRSQKAASKLQELGFKTIYELDGGILKWNAEGLSKPISNQVIGMTIEAYQTLLKTDKLVLIDFYAEWCGSCKKMAPYLIKMEKEKADKVVIIRLDADKNKTLVADLKIDVLPTLLLYDKQKLKWKNTGFINETDLIKQLQ